MLLCIILLRSLVFCCWWCFRCYCLFVLLASRLLNYFLSNHRCYFCSQLVCSPFPHGTWISLWGQQGFPSYGSWQFRLSDTTMQENRILYSEVYGIHVTNAWSCWECPLHLEILHRLKVTNQIKLLEVRSNVGFWWEAKTCVVLCRIISEKLPAWRQASALTVRSHCASYKTVSGCEECSRINSYRQK